MPTRTCGQHQSRIRSTLPMQFGCYTARIDTCVTPSISAHRYKPLPSHCGASFGKVSDQRPTRRETSLQRTSGNFRFAVFRARMRRFRFIYIDIDRGINLYTGTAYAIYTTVYRYEVRRHLVAQRPESVEDWLELIQPQNTVTQFRLTRHCHISLIVEPVVAPAF